MVGLFSYRHARIATVLAFSGLIAACGGGGGGGEPKNEPVAKLQSVDGPYTALETRESSSGAVRIHLQVASTDANTVAASFELGSYNEETPYPAPLWFLTRGVRFDADGMGATDLGPSQLVMIQRGVLMTLDLSATRLGAARRLTNLSDVCMMERTVQQLSTDGKQAWMVVYTAGPDRHCATAQDNAAYFVSPGMSETEAPVPASAAGLQILVSLIHPTQEAQGVLVREQRTGDLWVYDNTLRNRKYLVRSAALAVTDKANGLVDAPPITQTGFVLLGNSIHAVDWRTGSLTLGPAIATIQQPAKTIKIARSAQYVYLAFDHTSLVLDTTGRVVHQEELPVERGVITEVWPTQSGFAVRQAVPPKPNDKIEGPSVLYGFNASTSHHLERLSAAAGRELRIAAVSGDTVFVSQLVDWPGNFFWHDIYSVNLLDNALAQPVARSVHLFAQSRGTYVKPGLDLIEQLLWCQAPAGSRGCIRGEILSYDVAAGTPTTLGQIGDQGGAYAASAADGGMILMSGQTNFISLRRWLNDGAATAESVWVLQPRGERSLRQATLLPS